MLGPKNESEKVVFAEEALRVDVQHQIQMLMTRKKIDRDELAKRMGLSRNRVCQLFSSHANLTTRTIARVFSALGEAPTFSSKKGP